MNERERDRLEGLAERLEGLSWCEAGDMPGHEGYFNMEVDRFPCGSPASIAQHALYMMGSGDMEPTPWHFEAAFGLTRDQVDEMIFAGSVNHLENIEPDVAADVIRRYLDSGEVYWPEEVYGEI